MRLTEILVCNWTLCRIGGHSSDANTKVYEDRPAIFKNFFFPDK